MSQYVGVQPCRFWTHGVPDVGSTRDSHLACPLDLLHLYLCILTSLHGFTSPKALTWFSITLYIKQKWLLRWSSICAIFVLNRFDFKEELVVLAEVLSINTFRLQSLKITPHSFVLPNKCVFVTQLVGQFGQSREPCATESAYLLGCTAVNLLKIISSYKNWYQHISVYFAIQTYYIGVLTKADC